MEPFLDEKRCFADADAFLAANKVDNAPSRMTIAITNPAIANDIHVKMCLVVMAVNGAESTDGVCASMHVL